MNHRTADMREQGVSDHVLVCTNTRSSEYPCCAEANGQEVLEGVKDWLREREVYWSNVRVAETSCLGLCSAEYQRSRSIPAIAGTRTSALERSPICFGRNSVPMERDSVSAPNRSKTIDRKRSDVDVLIVPQETSRRISSRRENRSLIANRVGPLCVLRLCVICRGVEEVDSVVSGVGSPGDERSGLVDRSARTVARRWGWSRHRNRASGRAMPSDRADV
jgi:hypothetical protein